MAFPFTRLRDYLARTTPSIKASDLNAFQDYFNHLWNGTRSLKRLIVDGVGDVDTSAYTAGAATLNGAAGDTNPAIETTSAPTGLKLLWRIKITATPLYLRLYSSATGFIWTVNAGYNGATKFVRDTNSVGSYYLSMGYGTGIVAYYYDATSAVDWLTSDIVEIGVVDFSTIPRIKTTGRVAVGSTAVIGSGTVGVTAAPWCATTAADGEIYKGLTCIGGGVVALDGSLTAGANVYEITNPNPGEYRITLNSAQSIAWANVNYKKTSSQPITSLRMPTVDYATSGGRIVIKVFWKEVDVSTDPSTSIDANTEFTFVAFGKV